MGHGSLAWAPSSWAGAPASWAPASWAPASWAPASWAPASWAPASWAPASWAPASWAPASWAPARSLAPPPWAPARSLAPPPWAPARSLAPPPWAPPGYPPSAPPQTGPKKAQFATGVSFGASYRTSRPLFLTDVTSSAPPTPLFTTGYGTNFLSGPSVQRIVSHRTAKNHRPAPVIHPPRVWKPSVRGTTCQLWRPKNGRGRAISDTAPDKRGLLGGRPNEDQSPSPRYPGISNKEAEHMITLLIGGCTE
jgi:hypothetical protein